MLDLNKHKILLLQILKDIYANLRVAPFLGFKGGTACYLFYNLPRFSVDLDFDLLSLETKEVVSREIEKIIKEYGQIKEKFDKRNTLFFLLSYSRPTAP